MGKLNEVRRFFRRTKKKIGSVIAKYYFVTTVTGTIILSTLVACVKVESDAKAQIIDESTVQIEEQISIEELEELFRHEEIYIAKNDETVWTVAIKYNKEGEDLTPWVNTIKDINELESDNLKTGQQIKIFYYSKK